MLKERDSTNVPADVTNPFISKVPQSPARTSSTDDSLKALREGMGRLDIASRKGSVDLSASTASNRENRDARGRDLDRFVPSRPPSLHHSSHSSSTLPTLALDASSSQSPNTSIADHSADLTTSSLSATLGIPTSNRRILSFRAAPPAAASASTHLDQQRAYLLHAPASTTRGSTTAGPGAQAGKKRAPPYIPDRVLDAPGFADDYYLNLIDWSCANRVAIGLGDVGYVWDAETGAVTALGDGSDESTSVCSVSWSNDGAYLAIGNDAGEVEIWDVEEGKKMRVMAGHRARVPVLSWNGHTLSSGCRDGSIWHHDVRVAKHKVMELVGHTAEVCGLTWRSDGQFLASGGNDNVVNCWDGRIGQSVLQGGDGVPRGVAKWTKRNHTAAVKALAWCPWQTSLLATGGGSHDKHIHFWNSTTGARTASLQTESQVTSLVWSPHAKELLSTHGYPSHNLSLWSYPALSKIYDVPAHDNRVLCSSLSPDGTTVATGAGDENLKFWKIWEARVGKKAGAAADDGEGRNKSAVRIR